MEGHRVEVRWWIDDVFAWPLCEQLLWVKAYTEEKKERLNSAKIMFLNNFVVVLCSFPAFSLSLQQTSGRPDVLDGWIRKHIKQ